MSGIVGGWGNTWGRPSDDSVGIDDKYSGLLVHMIKVSAQSIQKTQSMKRLMTSIEVIVQSSAEKASENGISNTEETSKITMKIAFSSRWD